MKKVTLLAVLALASAAWAQDDKKEEAKPAAQVEQTAPSKPAATKIRFTNRRFQDARHCLDKGDNTEIIKCAEAYL
jgi:hypothetical protein